MERKLDAMSDAIVQLCTELKEDKAHNCRVEQSRSHDMHSTMRAIGRLASATSLHSKCTLALQVEMGHYSGDIARGLQQITGAVEPLQTSLVATGGGADTTLLKVKCPATAVFPLLMPQPSKEAIVGTL